MPVQDTYRGVWWEVKRVAEGTVHVSFLSESPSSAAAAGRCSALCMIFLVYGLRTVTSLAVGLSGGMPGARGPGYRRMWAGR